GQSKPIAVPPEMLMVPEWMWSDNAPIITSLSKTEGEIGDEIVIRGQGFQGLTFDDGTGDVDTPPQVKFTNQSAEILSSTATELKVRVPIGARAGTLIVYAPSTQPGFRLPGELIWIPSNSVRFKVTTQFGMIAKWHDLPGWSKYDFVQGDLHKPDVVRLENNFMFDTRGELDLPFRDDPLACRWDGKLGVPGDFLPDDKSSLIEFQTHGRIRVTLGDVTKETGHELTDGDQLQTLRFEVNGGAERYLLLSIDFTDESQAASLRIVELQWVGHEWPNDNEKGAEVYEEIRLLPYHWFFPPTVPPKPPEILNAKPIVEEGEQPVALPYDALVGVPSIRVGQEFSFELKDYGPADLWLSKPVVTIDGVLLPYSVTEENWEIAGEAASRKMVCTATMPPGVGAGRMVAQISVVTGDPYFIDVGNRGLVGYLYDVPEGSGLSKLPDLAPLTCFKVRKDRQINFESVADFDLPFPAETFVIEWLGGLIIEEEGDYEFICRSDDGMKLWLDDNVVIDADHPQAPAENTATVHLVPGVYRFRMQFFENNQHEVCVLEWHATRGEGEALEELIPRQVIPARAYSLDVHPAFPAKTSTGKRTDGS
ncbi:MAG: IPT/TIG domain-containing protein, partial [Planctomycetes bacterium]|nr:IPT/TIG domain-containing protein [Planctomycetota bacterium]